MPNDPKEPINFRIGRRYKDVLERLAGAEDQPLGRFVRELVEGYVTAAERAEWERAVRRGVGDESCP